MFMLVLGMVLGFSLGFIMLALLTKSKEADERACRVIGQTPPLVKENLLVSQP